MPQFTPEPTADGSFTFFSDRFGEAFHSRQGARLEAELKFVQPTLLTAYTHPPLAQQPRVRLLDVCYGLGYNTAAALDAIWRINPTCRVEWIGLEQDPAVPQAAIAHQLLQSWSDPIPALLASLAQTHRVETDRFQGHLLIGDARQTIQQVLQPNLPGQKRSLSRCIDAIFLDPFSPPHCPPLWTVEFIDQLARCLQPDGKLATYSCAAAVRTALRLSGLSFGATAGVGRRSPGTIASFNAEQLPPLSRQEQEHLQTRAAIPYRDPSLTDLAATIVQRRLNEQATSHLEPTSRWKKRWQTGLAASCLTES